MTAIPEQHLNAQSTTSKGSRKKVIVMLIVALVLIAGSCCVCLGGVWLWGVVEEDQNVEVINTREGRAFGTSHTTDGCVREGYVREQRCGLVDGLCMNGSAYFLKACLTHTSNPDMSICDGAPLDPQIMTDEAYMLSVCMRYGWAATDMTANGIVTALEQWCAINRTDFE